MAHSDVPSDDGDLPDDDLSDALVLSKDQAQQLDEFRRTIRLCANDSDKYELCSRRRDDLLAAHGEVRLLIAAFERVMRECSEYRALKLHIHATTPTDDTTEQWKHFIDLATERPKVECIRCLKRVGLLWGQGVTQHYGWASKQQKFCKALRAGALENQDWAAAVVKLNRLMLYRHQTLGRRQIRHSVSPIDQVDLQNLAAWKDQGPFKIRDSSVMIPFEPLAISDLPPCFGFDTFGLLVRVEFAVPPSPTNTGSNGNENPNETAASQDTQGPAASSPSSPTATLSLSDTEMDTELLDPTLVERDSQHSGPDPPGASSDARSVGQSLRPRPDDLHYRGMAGVARTKSSRGLGKELAPRPPSKVSEPTNQPRSPPQQHRPTGPREAILDGLAGTKRLRDVHHQGLAMAAAVGPAATATQADQGFGAALHPCPSARKRRHSLSSLDYCTLFPSKKLHDHGGGAARHFASYLDRSAHALHRAKGDAATFLASATPGSRLHTELPCYIEVLDKSVVGEPITARQYGAGTWSQPVDNYVICTPEEARTVLAAGALRLPILVPGELNPERRLDLDHYLAFLRTRTSIDVHLFDVPLPRGDYVLPRRMSTKEAVGRFRHSDSPLNFLNLAGHKANPVPRCFEGLPAYSILRDVPSDLWSGKKGERLVSDLSECASFQICSKRGAFSLPHVDQHGVVTAVFCDQGEKVWNMWTGLGIDALREYAESDSLPTTPCTSLVLYSGCLLIMPSGTLHAVWSPTDVLMSGTMYWDSRDLLRIAQLTQCTAEFPHLSNEDVAREFASKMDKIAELWEANSPVWPWGPADHLGQFKDAVEVSRADYKIRRGKGAS